MKVVKRPPHIIPFQDWNQIKFLNFLFTNLNLNSNYTLLFQYSLYETQTYYMLHRQIGVVVRETHDLKNYRNIFSFISERLEYIKERYEVPNPDFIVFYIKEISVET